MSISREAIDAPLSPTELAQRWRDLCGNPTFEDVAGKIEITEWGEIYTPSGRVDTSSFPVTLDGLFGSDR